MSFSSFGRADTYSPKSKSNEGFCRQCTDSSSKTCPGALTQWLSWLQSHPIHQKAVGSISSQGTYLGCRFHTWLGHRWKAPDRCFSHTDVSSPLCLSLPLSLKHRWQTQGLRAESGPPPCFIWPGTLFLPRGSAKLSPNC